LGTVIEGSAARSRVEPRAASRPLGVALAAALLGVVAVAGLMVGPYLIVLGTWVADRVGDATPLVLAIETILGVGCIAIGIGAGLTARGLWRSRAWAWPAALAIGLVLLMGMAVVWLVGTWVSAYALVVVIAASLIASLLPASVRRAFGL
jgi:hypothetical protein